MGDQPAVSLDVGNAALWRGAERVALRPKELDVLRCLIEQRGRLVAKAALMEAGWPGVAVTDAVLKVCINRLRAALGDDSHTPRFIETVHRRGYRLVGEIAMLGEPMPTAPPPDVVGRRPRPRIVGRELELTRLEQCFARTTLGERQVVFVTGEAGFGKTALIDAFLETRASGVRTARGQCVESYGAREAYMPVFEALGRLCRGRQGRKVVTQLARHAPTWLAQMPALVPAAEWQSLASRTAGASRERMLRELADALDALTRTTSLVLVLEDLHWSDVSTIELLSVLARRRAPGRLLVLGSYRPEDVPQDHGLSALVRDLSLHGLAVELPVPPFSEAAVETWFGARFPGAVFPPGLPRAAHRRTDGHPLFLSALAEHWVAHGMFVETRGRWEVKADLEPLERAVPADVRRMIEARFGRLGASERRLVEAASVAGVEFPAASVAAALDEPVADVDERCADLARRGLLLRARGEEAWPDATVSGRYDFVHALYRDVIRDQVPVARRVDFHRRVAIREEAGYGDAAGRIAARLAMHFEEAHDYRAAARHALQAARNAVARGGYHEAIAHASAGLHSLGRLPNDRETAEQAIDLHFELRNALLPLGEQRKILDHMRQAETLAEGLNDHGRLARACAYLTEYFRQAGAPDRSMEYGERALRLATAAGDFPVRVLANYFLGTACHDVGDYRRAIDCLRHNVTALVGERRHERFGLPGLVSVLSRSRLSTSAAELGAFAEGAAAGEEALRIAESVEHPFTLTHALFGLGDLVLCQGDLAMAIRLLERALELGRAGNIRTWLPTIGAALGHAYALSGRVAEALPLLERAVEQASAMGIGAMQSRRLAYLSAAYLLDGRTKDAATVARRSLGLARDLAARGYEADALHQIGDVHAHPQCLDVDTAESSYREALTLADELGMRPLEAHCHLGLGVLFRRTERTDQAGEELSTAIELFRSMEMTFWVAKAEAARSPASANPLRRSRHEPH